MSNFITGADFNIQNKNEIFISMNNNKFFNKNNLPLLIKTDNDLQLYFSAITIPNDSKITIIDDIFFEITQTKTDIKKFDWEKVIDCGIWEDLQSCHRLVANNSEFFKLCKVQDESLSINAVSNNGYLLEYVWKQTDLICLTSVRQIGKSIRYVIEQTHDLQMEAISRDYLSYYWIKYPTERVSIEAMKYQYGDMLEYDKIQTENTCLAAVKCCGDALKYIKKASPVVCMEAVKQDGLSLYYVENQTVDICVEAVKQNRNAIRHVKRYLLELVK